MVETSGLVLSWNQDVKKKVPKTCVSPKLVLLLVVTFVAFGSSTTAMDIGPCTGDWNHKYPSDCDEGEIYCKCHPESKHWLNFAVHCVHVERVCDHKLDCADGKDENRTICNVRRKCPVGALKCADRKQCIPSTLNCNTVMDCYDQSDEPDDCIYDECSGSQKKCGDGMKCLEKTRYCVGKPQPECADGLDEDHDFCLYWSCLPFYESEKCDSRDECVEISKKCDGIHDCKDHSDESWCSSCDNGALLCDAKRYGKGKCVVPAEICDGVQLCRDGADEFNCEERKRTTTTEKYEVDSGAGMLKTPIVVITVSALVAACF